MHSFARQIGNVQRWRFKLISDKRPSVPPAGTLFVLYMTAFDGTVKIAAGACTFADGDWHVYYTPNAGDVDTAGIYRVQVFGSLPDSSPLVCPVVELRIKANVV
jgi:hypothetical protein